MGGENKMLKLNDTERWDGCRGIVENPNSKKYLVLLQKICDGH